MTKNLRRSKAPAPIHPVGGSPSWALRPPAIRIPTQWPTDFPAELAARMEVVLRDARDKASAQMEREKKRGKFPTKEKEMVAFCGYAITELTPDFFRQFDRGSAFQWMDEMVRSVLIFNYENPARVRLLKEEVRESAEWLALAKKVAEGASASEKRRAPGDVDSTEFSRRERVDSFFHGLYKALKRKFNRDEFSQVANVDPAELRRWQRNAPDTSDVAAKKIEKTLSMKPDEFLAAVNSKNRR